jgi:hypothetical protein
MKPFLDSEASSSMICCVGSGSVVRFSGLHTPLLEISFAKKAASLQQIVIFCQSVWVKEVWPGLRRLWQTLLGTGSNVSKA